jgi:hypothetical protein
MRMRICLLAVAITIGLLAAAANAAAVVRYASPTGSGSACTNAATPCAIDVAINATGANDEVALLGGVPPAAPFVTSTALSAATGVDIHGAPGARPVIQSSASGNGVTILGGSASLADVVVVYTGGAAAVQSNGGTVSRISAYGGGSSTAACAGNSGAFFADSICRYTGLGVSHGAFVAETGTTTTVNLLNVTAISNGSPGVASRSTNSSSVNLTAANTIAQGFPEDVYAFKTSAGNSNVTMVFSNFATSGMDTGATATAAGSGANLTTPPVFVDRANGDFRQLATSTGTIDKGTSSLGLGSFDFEGEARTQGAAPDIGADEGSIIVGGGSTPSTSTPPTPAAKKKCKKKKRKRAARAAKKCKKHKKR